MRISFLAICFCIFSAPILTLAADVTFINNSEKLLKCSKENDKEYIPFLRLKPNGLKRFENFAIGSKIRCSTQISEIKRSSTMLTYFTVKTAGIYELLQANVKCDTCPSKVRLATIVTYPNGDSDYTHFK